MKYYVYEGGVYDVDKNQICWQVKVRLEMTS